MEIHKRYLVSQNVLLSALTFIFKRLLSSIPHQTQRRTTNMDDDEVPKDTRKLGFQMCKESIGGVWSEIEEKQFKIRRLSGGLTNYLYMCSIPGHIDVPDNQPRTVLLRVYGDIAKSSKFVVQNSVVFALMSEKRLGPKLYGMNQQARIEEFIPTKCLVTANLHNPTLSRMVARRLAQFHNLDMPLCKEPRFLNDTMDKWIIKVKESLEEKRSPSDAPFFQKFRSYHLDEELEVLKDMLSKVDSPVVFSHNDLQEGNILYLENCDDPKKQMTVIDWEYCSYNYRGYDFGNHFVEWCYDYTFPEYPYYKVISDDYPTKDEQTNFFCAYLNEMGCKVTDEVLSQMYVEANTFALASHFFWGLWSILQNEMSSIQFGFLEYADSRFSDYFRMKESLPQMGIHLS